MKLKTALLATILISSTAHAQPPPRYPTPAELEERDAQLRLEGEEIARAEKARSAAAAAESNRRSRDSSNAAIQAYRASEKARADAAAKAKEEADARVAEAYERYTAEMKGPGGKPVLSALVCIAHAKHNEFLAYIRQDNKYARTAGVVNLRQRSDWKDELIHWDMVGTLAKRDGGKAACRSKPVACLLSEDCESPHAWLFARAWEEYTMAAYQEVP